LNRNSERIARSLLQGNLQFDGGGENIVFPQLSQSDSAPLWSQAGSVHFM
jgi:hypothetical protein